VRRAGHHPAPSPGLRRPKEPSLARLSQANSLVVEYGYAADGESALENAATRTRPRSRSGSGTTTKRRTARTLFHVFAGGQRICATFLSRGRPWAVKRRGRRGHARGYYYHQDHLNSSSALSGSAGSSWKSTCGIRVGRTADGQPAGHVPGVEASSPADAGTRRRGIYLTTGALLSTPELGRFIQADTIIPRPGQPPELQPLRLLPQQSAEVRGPGWAGRERGRRLVANQGERRAGYLNAGPSHWIWNGTGRDAQHLHWGLADPLRFGSDAGRIYEEGGSGWQIAGAVVTEGGRAVALVPVGAAIGKGAGALAQEFRVAGREAAGTLAEGWLDAAFRFG